jgi:pilus assembly protein Flp/PilA
MNDKLMKIYIAAMRRLREENGQDLIEYALVAALIALAAVAGVSTLGKGISNIFSILGSQMAQYT